MKRIVLLSGGVDSTVCLAVSIQDGAECVALSFDYGQQHRIELDRAGEIAKHYGAQHFIVNIDPTVFGGASLTGGGAQYGGQSAPVSYVPARNLLFLAYAAALAEIVNAEAIVIGANLDDQTGYPDCRRGFLDALQTAVGLATFHGSVAILSPLVGMSKAETIAKGRAIGAPLERTWSCYQPQNSTPCGSCAACVLRGEA